MIVKMNNIPIYDITSRFEQQESFRDNPHTGIDLNYSVGDAVISPTSGKVVEVVDYGNVNAGKTIIIENEQGQQLIFGHLSKFEVSQGDIVHIGQKIAESGNTGHVVGSGHLHVGLKEGGQYIDPSHYVNIMQDLTKDYISNDNVPLFSQVKEYLIDTIFQPTNEVGMWILKNLFVDFSFDLHELFFKAPAVLLLVLTIMVGKNFTTKWILPLFYSYFVVEAFQ